MCNVQQVNVYIGDAATMESATNVKRECYAHPRTPPSPVTRIPLKQNLSLKMIHSPTSPISHKLSVDSLSKIQQPVVLNIGGRVLRLMSGGKVGRLYELFECENFITRRLLCDLYENGQYYFARPPCEADIIADFVILG
jgi:hypothetical protein